MSIEEKAQLMLAQLEAQRTAMVQQITAYDGAIQAIRQLLTPEPPSPPAEPAPVAEPAALLGPT